MPQIPLPEITKLDIYSFGFDKSLNRNFLIGKEISLDSDNPVVYDIISGAVPAQSIKFGSLEVGSGNNMFGVDPANGIWLGNAIFGSGPFRVNMAGAVTASNITITGGSISSTPISSIPNNTSTDISLLEKTWTMVFSVTDADTIAWGSGTITLSNGRTFTIDAGNTGNMAALTYIYLDPAVSSTVLQTTTTAATALGANKILIGVAQNNTVTANWIPYGPGQLFVDGVQIGALSIVAGNIAASTITAGKMSVSQLSAIAADMGSITAGSIVMPSGGLIRAGQTAFNTGTGFYLGNDAGTPKFSIGVSTGNRLTWDGTTLTVQGTLGGSLNSKVGLFSTAVTVSNTTTETDLFNFSLAANSLSTNNVVYGKIFISNFKHQTGNFTLKAYYGATSASDVIGLTAAHTAGDEKGYIDFWIVADGATNDQVVAFDVFTKGEKSVDTDTAPVLKGGEVADAAIDSTAAQTIKITAQWATADVSNVITVRAGFAELIRA